MKHRYPYPILSLLLTAAFFLSGCTQDLLPAAAENDAEILSETAPPSAPPTVSPSPAHQETEIQDFPDALQKPAGNSQGSEEGRKALYETAAPLYLDDFSYLMEKGYSYTFVDIGVQYPVMLVAAETFTYEDTAPIQACMWCNVYYLEEGSVRLLDSLSSLGTAYPIAFDETGLYEAGSKGVRKWTIKVEDGSPKLVVAEDAYVSCDESGNPFYSCEKYGKTLEISEAVYQRLADGYQAALAVSFEESPAYSMPAEALDLMQALEDASGHKMEKYIYVDMDHDGKEEMMGAYEEKFCVWPIWYASSDNSLCQPVTGLSRGYDTCSFEKLDFQDETHIAICDSNMLGTGKQYSIYRLGDQELQPLVQNQYGYVYQDRDGNIILDVEAYDAQYDADRGHMTGHTWTDTYLYYEDGRYKEYGALILSDMQFLQYDNAADLLADIRSENAEDEFQFTYFLRENGIVHIQCDRTTENGSIYYYHYTLHAEGSHLVGGLENKNNGRMDTCFSTLEVTYPETEPFL